MFKEYWVLFSLEIKTGKFLGACPGPKRVDPQLRLKISIFLLVIENNTLNFADLAFANNLT